jgi:anti-sigma regulatory factor (Ser/Thr protein kinase)
MPNVNEPQAPDAVYAVAVSDWPDVHVAVQATRRHAVLAGFSARGQVEIAIVATELCTNIVRHAGGGELRVRIVEDAERGRGVEIVARDAGPPIADLAVALTDGCDGAGPIPPERLLGRRGLGTGLGAVQRMTHTLEYSALPNGKEIRVVRFLDAPLPQAPGGSRR